MNEITLNTDLHTYVITNEDGSKKELLSVTKLLAKHGLAPDYSGVSTEILGAKAGRGTIIHEELEKYVKTGEIGFTGELELFMNKAKEQSITPEFSEFIVYNDEIAGMVDVAGKIGEHTFLGDYKTSSVLHKEAVAWQLSIYQYLSGITYDKLLAFHFPNSEELKVVEIEPIPVEEIEKLLECERNCELYTKRTLELSEEENNKILVVQKELKALDDRKKQLELQEKEVKEYLIAKMEETGIKSVDNDYFKITYVACSERKTIDTGKLKEEQPEIAEQYSKITTVKPSVRITLK